MLTDLRPTAAARHGGIHRLLKFIIPREAIHAVDTVRLMDTNQANVTQRQDLYQGCPEGNNQHLGKICENYYQYFVKDDEKSECPLCLV